MMTIKGGGPVASVWQLFVTGAVALVFGLTVLPASVRGDDSATVQLHVEAGEDFGNPFTYQWRATDGHIVDQNSTTTDWTLANGPGIHFAYVGTLILDDASVCATRNPFFGVNVNATIQLRG